MQFDISEVQDGILLVDKPAGWTSFDVCAKIRGQIRQDYHRRGETPTKRQLRVGHAGTLDPFATGLLIILLGDATKRSDEFLKQDKVYEATFTLGAVSSTGDPEGELTAVSGLQPTEQQIQTVLTTFTGMATQTPPVYSAIKIDGQRAYKLARKGQEVTMPPREVMIHSLELVDYTYPQLRIRAHVSSGTYIRSLAQDIGQALGCGAYCSQLRRTGIGEAEVGRAVRVQIVSNID